MKGGTDYTCSRGLLADAPHPRTPHFLPPPLPGLPQTARRIIDCPQFHGEVDLLKYDQITSMYGAVHCTSQVIKRAAL